MDARLQQQKKKVVITAACLAAISGSVSTLPTLAARHHFPAVWVTLPLIAFELVGVTYVFWQYAALLKLKRSLRA